MFIHGTSFPHSLLTNSKVSGSAPEVPDLSLLDRRVETELGHVRVAMFLDFTRLCIHPTFVLLLVSGAEFAREPSFCCGSWLAGLSLVYLAYYPLLQGWVTMTPSRMVSGRILLRTVTWVAAVGSGFGDRDSFPGRMGILLGSHVLTSILFRAGAGTVIDCLCTTVVWMWATTQIYGQNAMNLWLVVFHLAFQLLVCIGVPFLLERTLRERIIMSFQSQDSNSLIAGFRQILKGVCDGELLLDNNFQVCGSAPCLQRLLASNKDFTGCCFRELIDDELSQLVADWQELLALLCGHEVNLCMSPNS